MSSTVRTRIAPSPTGEVHIGTLRTALYDYALAKKFNGQFILRIEDTDQKRYVPGSDDRMLEVFKQFGLVWDEGPYIQSQRNEIYQQYIKELLDKGHAYYCFCTEDRLKSLRETQKAAKKIPKYDRHCLNLTPDEVAEKLKNKEPYVIRMKIPDNETIVFNDLVRGTVKFNTNDVDDQVLVKSNGIPTYHFAVVVDDHLMNITHVFRGEEWLPSVPKHVLLYRYFGWEVPKHAHLSLFLDPSHPGKMSKRFGTVSAQGFLEEGYLPEAMLNFLMLLGWNPGTEQEIYSLPDFVQAFEIEKLNKKPAIFDRKKLDYFNGLYIRQKTNEELFPYFKKFLPQATDEQVDILVPILKERLVKFGDLPEALKFLFEEVIYDKSLLLKKGTAPELAKEMLSKTKELFSDFSNLQERILQLVDSNSWNRGEYFMVLRVAICGSEFTPPVVDCLPALGQENTIRKLDLALSLLN